MLKHQSQHLVVTDLLLIKKKYENSLQRNNLQWTFILPHKKENTNKIPLYPIHVKLIGESSSLKWSLYWMNNDAEMFMGDVARVVDANSNNKQLFALSSEMLQTGIANVHIIVLWK